MESAYTAPGGALSSPRMSAEKENFRAQSGWRIFSQDVVDLHVQKFRTSSNRWAVGAEKLSDSSSLAWTDILDSYATKKASSSSSLSPSSESPGNMHSFFAAEDASNFESSLSGLFNTKMTVSDTEPCVNQLENRTSLQKSGKNESIMPDAVSYAIRSLLPDDEDQLLAGIMDDFDSNFQNGNLEDSDDLDLFSSGGGLELEGELQDQVTAPIQTFQNLDAASHAHDSQFGVQYGPASVVGEHPFGEHPSRTLFVRNINSNVEDIELKALFEQYGEIRTLYTACKHRGFVMISYYDIRAARSAMRALQNKPLRRRKLDIHFSIPKDNPSDKDINQGTLVVFNLDSSVSNDDLRQIFGVYGEIKEIRETPHKRHHKFIEFYDVRGAEAALRALNRSDIAGKRIKLEPSRPGGIRRSLMQQVGQELDVDDNRGFWQLIQSPMSPCNNSSPGYMSQLGSPGVMSENGVVMESVNQGNSTSKLSNRNGISTISSQRLADIAGTIPSFTDQTQSANNIRQFGSAFQHRPSMHAHSLPDTGNSFQNFLNPVAGSVLIPSPTTLRSINASDASRLQKATPGVNDVGSFGSTNGVIGASRSESLLHSSTPSGSLACQQFLWGTPSPFNPTSQSPGQMPWSNSLGHGGHPHSYGGPSGHQLNAAFAPHVHQMGSRAACGEPPMLRIQSGFTGDSPSIKSCLRSDSVGTARMVPSHRTTIGGVASLINMRHTYSGCGSYDQGSSTHFRVLSPQLRTGIAHFSGSPRSLDGLRRGDSFSLQADNNKLFQLDLDRILQGDDARTTLMIKNIPNKYTSKMLLAAIDELFRGTYDFIYLPIDFKAFNGKKWEKFNSEKVASLAYARIQGKGALIAHFQNSSLMNEDKRCRPILFHSDGPNVGDQEPFPVGDNVRTRPGKEPSSNGGSYHGSPTTPDSMKISL